MTKFSVERGDEEDQEESDGGGGSESRNSYNSPKRKRHRTLDSQNLVKPEKEDVILVTTIDPEVLDCTICMEPLIPPVFQLVLVPSMCVKGKEDNRALIVDFPAMFELGSFDSLTSLDWVTSSITRETLMCWLGLSFSFTGRALWKIINIKGIHVTWNKVQCENGHIACSSCCIKLGNKCPSCSWPIGYSRCLAIEKVIESIKVSCQYAQYGCGETFNYAQKHTHEEICSHSPCMCPIHDCSFTGSSEQLSLHFSDKHWSSARHFRFNCPFMVSFEQDETFLVFQEEEEDLLFLLNNRIELIGTALTVTCFGENPSMAGFSYDLVSRRGSSSLRLHSFTNYVKGKAEASATEFLLLPYDFNRSSGKLKLEICIWSSKGSE
ncbi:hypothetical protein GIB67_010934 [Kingdonia uniflora]|uniref:SIAH-type domain-containing protein n=1 Tax=Kingdonia uniflora TaxID=39325 RepID=A0A7J7M4W5_9MAGN|nr:hypothetical protein GIB67_010934 [Kingdonia uniflora]